MRDGIRRLPRFPLDQTINLSEVAGFLRLERPVSVRSLMTRLDSMPDEVPFHAVIVGDGALGGEVTLTLSKDGSYKFEGFMRASGATSFSFRVSAVVRSASNQVMVMAQHSGDVLGSDTPGDRQDNWRQWGVDPDRAKVIRNCWPDISVGTMVATQTSELAGVLGAGTDVLMGVARFLVAAETLGTGLALCLTIGSELENHGVALPSVGGVPGLFIESGAVYLFGPSAIVPAFIAGVALEGAIEQLVKIRPLDAREMAFAQSVFENSLDLDRIRLTNLIGSESRPFTVPTLGDIILVNIGGSFESPLQSVSSPYPAPGQILIHELTHAWQIHNATPDDGYVPGWLCGSIVNQTLKAKPYDYGPAGQPWGSFNFEAQGAIVDQWFGGNGAQNGTSMSEASSYFQYIVSNVRTGQA
ncbi:MAG: hypothetical protein ABIN79_10520 [Marmoricola sp.]